MPPPHSIWIFFECRVCCNTFRFVPWVESGSHLAPIGSSKMELVRCIVCVVVLTPPDADGTLLTTLLVDGWDDAERQHELTR